MDPAPTQPPAAGPEQASQLTGVIQRNIAALAEVRRREEARKTISDHIADAITRFAGSMWCAYVHAFLVAAWLLINTNRIPWIRPFDPFPFVMLAMIASVEAIFLSTFILISQNRMQRIADNRAELDLQISLLTEHELTRAIHLLDDIAQRVGTPRPPDPELQEIKRDVHPEAVVEQISHAEEQAKQT